MQFINSYSISLHLVILLATLGILQKLSEGRVMAFNHEIVPDYLRTKPEMDVEKKIKTCRDRAANMSNEVAHKQINMFNRICTHLLGTVQSKREEWKNDESKFQLLGSVFPAHGFIGSLWSY